MTRKKENIDPIRGQRLSLLLVENGMKQKDLAQKLNYTEQHISCIIRGKRSLTLDVAKRIIELFPGTRIEWLLGYDEFMTPFDLDYYSQKSGEEAMARLEKSDSILMSFLSDIAETYGYALHADGLPLDDCEVEYIKVSGKDGQIVGNISRGELYSCAEEIRDFSEFLVNRHIIESAIRRGVVSDAKE